MRGKGTTEAIITKRKTMEKIIHKHDTELCGFSSLTITVTFVTVKYSEMWQALDFLGVSEHLTWLLYKIYEKELAVIRINDYPTEQFSLGQGVRQECLLFPILFNPCGEIIIRER